MSGFCFPLSPSFPFFLFFPSFLLPSIFFASFLLPLFPLPHFSPTLSSPPFPFLLISLSLSLLVSFRLGNRNKPVCFEVLKESQFLCYKILFKPRLENTRRDPHYFLDGIFLSTVGLCLSARYVLKSSVLDFKRLENKHGGEVRS